MKACYPGTFDPITLGHVDVIERAAKLFDEVVVVISHNPRKRCTFTIEERMDMIKRSVSTLSCSDRIRVCVNDGLTVRFAAEHDINAIVRGIRAVSDYEYELTQATANMMLDGRIETVFLIARPEYSFLSSSAVKEIAENDGEFRSLVPECIYEEVRNRMAVIRNER
ncbi:MAG: pantetheine-phosphate adenylyltransferase [Bulleidia sp.]